MGLFPGAGLGAGVRHHHLLQFAEQPGAGSESQPPPCVPTPLLHYTIAGANGMACTVAAGANFPDAGNLGTSQTRTTCARSTRGASDAGCHYARKGKF